MEYLERVADIELKERLEAIGAVYIVKIWCVLLRNFEIFEIWRNFNHRVGAFLITELAQIRSVIWHNFIPQFGGILFGKMAKIVPLF